MKTLLLFVVVSVIAGPFGCRPPAQKSGVEPTPAGREEIILPAPRLKGGVSLEEAIAQRRSIREFTAQALTLEEISQLLWAAQGITDPRGFRAAPSAGALYPLEVYIATSEGLWRYLPQGHGVEVISEEDLRRGLWEAGLGQEALREAPAVVVIAGVYARTEAKYGSRAERYVHLEAGHAAQNILLQATALDLGAVPIGAFRDDGVKEAIHLSENQEPLYLIPVGHPR